MKLIFTALLFTAVGCESLGPSKIVPERMDYSDAIRNSAEQQLLKNLVRLRFGTSPELLDLTQVVSQYQLDSGGAIGASIVEGGSTTYPLSMSVSYQESPTITYSPVTGREFALRMLSPIQPWQIYLLSRSGWDLNRLLCATIQRMNGLQNLQTSFGMSQIPTPDSLSRFAEAAALMEELVIHNQLRITVATTSDRSPEKTTTKEVQESSAKSQNIVTGMSGFDGLNYFLVFTQADSTDPWKKKIDRLKSLLDLNSELNLFPMISSDIAYTGVRDGVIILANRSVLNLMLYLTAGIQVPPELAGLAPTAYDVVEQLDGLSTTEYMVYPSSVFTVYSGKQTPKNTFVAVRHEDYWFWIENTDRNSKTTFSLLEYLIRLQDAKSSNNAPGVLLTIPTR